MRLRYRLVGAGVLLTLTVGGTVGAAPIYGPTQVGEPVYEVGPVSLVVSQGELWSPTTDEGALDLGAVLRREASDRGDPVQIYDNLLDYSGEFGEVPKITFTEFDFTSGEPLTDQYQADYGDYGGVVFSDGNDIVKQDSLFVQDWWGAVNPGLTTNGLGIMEITFGVQQTHIGLYSPGRLRVELFHSETPDVAIWSSESIGDFGTAGVSDQFFGVAMQPDDHFDIVRLSDPYPGDPSVYIDNLYYEAVPEPGTIVLLGLGALAMIRWRK